MKVMCELDVKCGKEIFKWHPHKDKIVGGMITISNKHDTHFYEIRVSEKGRRAYIDVLEDGARIRDVRKKKRLKV
jgi:hypothetical protein